MVFPESVVVRPPLTLSLYFVLLILWLVSHPEPVLNSMVCPVSEFVRPPEPFRQFMVFHESVVVRPPEPYRHSMVCPDIVRHPYFGRASLIVRHFMLFIYTWYFL